MGSALTNTYRHHAISLDGDDVGGYAIMFTLDPNAPTPNFDDSTQGKEPPLNVPPVSGFYRAGAVLRENGEPKGWQGLCLGSVQAETGSLEGRVVPRSRPLN